MTANGLHDPHGVLTADLAQGPALVAALRDWEQATGLTPGGHRILAADITVNAGDASTMLRLTNRQAERLAQLLNTDTAIITAHRAATHDDENE